MVLKYHISPYPTLMEDMLVKIYEASNPTPGAEVYEETLAQDGGGGHSTQHTVTANGLDKVVHIVRLYTADSAILLHDYNAEPTTDLLEVFTPIKFKIGDAQPTTPLAGDNKFIHPSLVGLQEYQYTVHRNNYGYLFHGFHITVDPDEGSFTLLNDDVFNEEEEFLVQVGSKVVTTNNNDSVVGKWFSGFVDIVGAVTYDGPTHLRKMLRFVGSSTFKFQTGSSQPIGFLFCFSNVGDGPPNSLSSVIFENFPLQWNGGILGQFDLKLFQEAAFSFDGALWNLIYFCDTPDAVTTVKPGDILGAGLTSFGDVPSVTYREQDIIHSKNISGDYTVQISIFYTAGTVLEDTKVIAVWKHHPTQKANRFVVACREISGGSAQNISISWLLIKS